MQNEQRFFLKFERERKRVLFQPKLGQLPRIHNFHKEESTSGKECLVPSHICFLHRELQIIMTNDIP